jgi:hypothetical protein
MTDARVMIDSRFSGASIMAAMSGNTGAKRASHPSSVAISSAVSANEESARSSAMYTGSSPGLVVI